MPASSDKPHALVPYSLYLKVWLALILLTVVTVAVSYADMKQARILTALMIAALKMLLVMLYFMHVRFERPIFVCMIVVVLVTYGIFIGLTFSDYWYR